MQNLIAFLTDSAPTVPDPDAPINLADAILAPDALRSLIVNWRDVALSFIHTVHADASADGTEETAALLNRLFDYPDIPSISDVQASDRPLEPVLPMAFAKSDTVLRLFTTIATLGRPQDVTLEEIRIEHFFPVFPADDAGAALIRSWAE